MAIELTIGMAGAGGDGVVSAGDSLITAAAIDGYHAIQTKSFGPQIRGGESSIRIRISTEEILSTGEAIDVAIAMNWDDYLKFGGELPVAKGAIIIYDSKTGVEPDNIPLKDVEPSQVISVPIEEIAVENAGTAKAKNVVILGLLAGWFGISRDSLLAGIRKKFAKKAAEVLQGNERAYAAGIEYAEKNPVQDKSKVLDPPKAGAQKKMLTDGNEMIAAASIYAGVEFFGGYPITPSSEIMHNLAREIWRYGGSMLQAEDEIAGIGTVVGASFAGKKSLTATSGPGMSLKSEMLGLATLAELPLVCVNVQRGGPSTGIPTKSEQSDLFQAAFSAHGDALRPVLAPINVKDSFGITVEAFNISEEFQTPVIILSDQELSQRKDTFDPIDLSQFKIINRKVASGADLEDYTRYKFTDDHISPITYPGIEGGNYLAAGIEHNEKGAPTSSGEMHAAMNTKRIEKFNPIKEREYLFVIEGDANAELAIISWGSVAGVAMEAYNQLKAAGVSVKIIVPKLLFPISEKVYDEFFSGVRAGIVVEQSHQGQLYNILRMYVDVPKGMERLSKSGSNPIIASEIVDRINEMK